MERGGGGWHLKPLSRTAKQQVGTRQQRPKYFSNIFYYVGRIVVVAMLKNCGVPSSDTTQSLLHCRVVVVAMLKNCRVPSSWWERQRDLVTTHLLVIFRKREWVRGAGKAIAIAQQSLSVFHLKNTIAIKKSATDLEMRKSRQREQGRAHLSCFFSEYFLFCPCKKFQR